MFGYVQPLRPELKVKENEAFQGYYCGLCKAIKQNYTNSARLMLNYDCAVLLLLFSSMSPEAPAVGRRRCAVSPFRRKTVVQSEAAHYAAAINVLLGCAKIDDTVRDDHRVTAGALSLFYRRVRNRAKADFPEAARAFDVRLAALGALESQGSDSADAVAGEFGSLLADAFALAPFGFLDETAKRTLRHFGYNLGRWIYLADAVDDLEADWKGKRYNVFLKRPFESVAALRGSLREEAEFSLHYSLAEACRAYELLDIRRDKPLLDNIMYLGLAKKTQEVLKGKANGSI